jgi:hypothetical protein
MSKKSSFTIKNHIDRKGTKRITGLLKGKFGLDLSDINKALQGDQATLKMIGEAGRQGQLTQELMPILEEAYINLIKGTEAYNKGVANITKQGASSAIAIDRSVSQVMLASQKYDHQRKELAGEFASAKSLEDTRHEYAVNYIQLKAYIEKYLMKVDGQAKLIDQANRPEIKQMAEDSRYELAAAKHLLENGDNARLDLLPRREYTTVTEGNQSSSFKTTLQQKFGGVLSALGF